MNLHDFYYDLPQELIAQDPLEDRSSSRLMVLDQETGHIEHRRCCAYRFRYGRSSQCRPFGSYGANRDTVAWSNQYFFNEALPSESMTA